MAGVNAKEIKTRIRSMESTKQITKAMEMVAASKLRKAQTQVLNSRPYFEILYDTINDIVDSNRDFSSPYLVKRPVKKVMYIVIAGDRGLAGGYNSNVLKLVDAEIAGLDATVFPIGKNGEHNIFVCTVVGFITIGHCDYGQPRYTPRKALALLFVRHSNRIHKIIPTDRIFLEFSKIGFQIVLRTLAGRTNRFGNLYLADFTGLIPKNIRN